MIKIKEIYYYLFCQFYKLGKFRVADKSPQWTALLIMSLFETLNIFFLIKLFNSNYITKIEESNRKILILIGLIIIAIINTIIFLRNKNYNKFDKIIENESKKEKRNGRIFLSLYMVLSVLIFLVFEI